MRADDQNYLRGMKWKHHKTKFQTTLEEIKIKSPRCTFTLPTPLVRGDLPPVYIAQPSPHSQKIAVIPPLHRRRSLEALLIFQLVVALVSFELTLKTVILSLILPISPLVFEGIRLIKPLKNFYFCTWLFFFENFSVISKIYLLEL